MKTRTLGRDGPSVSAIGLGCMGISFGYADTYAIFSQAACAIRPSL
jgi:aryl-alcohol dehydrogenase-like predicted oxidoreductase